MLHVQSRTLRRAIRGCTRRDDTRPEFTSLMYVLGGYRSLSHELLIVRRHNSPRESHPLSLVAPLPSLHLHRHRAPPAHSSPLCTSALEIRASACLPAVTDEYVLSRAQFTSRYFAFLLFSIRNLLEQFTLSNALRMLLRLSEKGLRHQHCQLF